MGEMNLLLENVRCFAGEHRIPIRPLTFLVGENSTGKTTVLAALAAVLSGRLKGIPPVFNYPPFDMGSFSAVHSFNVHQKQARIAIGFEQGTGNEHAEFFKCSIAEIAGIPDSVMFDVRYDDASVKSVRQSGFWHHDIQHKDERLEKIYKADASSPSLDLFMLLSRVESLKFDWNEWTFGFVQLLEWIKEDWGAEIIALAPTRSRPERTYDNPSSGFSPEGDHVPYFLAGIGGNGKSGKHASAVLKKLKEYGIGSGLFKDIKVKRWGRKPGQPFQLLISLAGQKSNLPDVGYGVSQALPVVVESLRAKKGARILMQQPEVHLHPRAQAALGSLFCALVKDEGKKFVIETHSDYMVDRARMEVARGTISPDDFEILYFERKGKGVVVHPVHVDELGNIVDAPPNYREFFLHEQMDLLSRGARKRR